MHICIQMIEDIYSTEHTRNTIHIKNRKPKCSFHVSIGFILLIVHYDSIIFVWFFCYALASNDIPYRVTSEVIFSTDHSTMSLPNLEVLRTKHMLKAGVRFNSHLLVYIWLDGQRWTNHSTTWRDIIRAVDILYK